MTENEFLLADRIQKIKSMNELYDLENNAYISFSGGKDSTVLSRLIDEALPNNNIPRIYLNTGIEYKSIVQFVERERRTSELQSLCQNKISALCLKKSVIRLSQKNIHRKLVIIKIAE